MAGRGMARQGMMNTGVEVETQAGWDRAFDILADQPVWLKRQLDHWSAGTTTEVKRTQPKNDGSQLALDVGGGPEAAYPYNLEGGKMIKANVRMNLATIAANVAIEAGLPIEEWKHVLPLVEELAAKRKPRKPKILHVAEG